MTISKSNDAIVFDFRNDRISEATARELLGMNLMRLAAKATRSFDYTGLRHINRLIKFVVPSEHFVRLELNDDTHFEFPYGDGYWGRMLDNVSTYSRCEESFLKALKDTDYAFVDCGANFGYMSALVSGKSFGNKSSIAIEADPDSFSILERNWRLNGQRFDLRHNAVFSKSGEIVDFGGSKHEARSIHDAKTGANTHKVETLALNDLKPWISKQGCAHLILKLDVEGVEIDALKGADQLVNADPCIMYEDHAMDPTHEITRYLIDEMGMQIFYSEEDGCRRITELDEITRIKSNPRVGYDFIAVRGSHWPDKVASLRYRTN